MNEIVLQAPFLKKLDVIGAKLYETAQKIAPENIPPKLYRLSVIAGQIGSLFKCQYTDVRGFEKTEAADLLIQAIILNYMIAGDVSSQLELGIERLEEKVFEKHHKNLGGCDRGGGR